MDAFHWSPTTLYTVFVSNNLTDWLSLNINVGRNYTTTLKFSQFNYMMFPPNSVAYLYKNPAAPSINYDSMFVGAYYMDVNDGNYNTQPISINGIQVIDFHNDPNYVSYCACDVNTSTCQSQGYTNTIDPNIECVYIRPNSLPSPTSFEPPSTTWIWIVVASLAFCSLIIFVLIILFFVGAFKFGKSMAKEAESAGAGGAGDGDKSSSPTTKSSTTKSSTTKVK